MSLPLQALGGLLLVVSVALGTWAVAKMGWARLLFAGALFSPGPGRRRTTCRSASSWRGRTGRCETRSATRTFA